jgi:ribosome-binding protein aMBF1 (putative translation factor)
MHIGKVIGLVRHMQGWSQENLADEIGFSKAYITKIENGRLSPNQTFFERFEKMFGLTENNLVRMANKWRKLGNLEFSRILVRCHINVARRVNPS